MIENVSRRSFLKASGSLVLAVALPAGAQELRLHRAYAMNAFVRVGSDNTVTVIIKHLEMGQGTYTGLPALVAEELDADWSQMRAEGAPADAARYNNLFWGPAQGTGGSTALANSYEQLRKAGAAARAMLVAAAAEKWGVPAGEIRVSKGMVFHKNRKASFGSLAEAAAKQPVPTDLALKDPKNFRIIGKADLPRTDARAKSNGTALYTQDVKLQDMLTAVVLHPPRFGAVPAGIDAAKARQVPGVVDVVRFSTPARSGVAVLAKDYWTAKKGRDALLVEWDESNSFKLNSSDISKEYRRLAATPGLKARREGDPDAALAGAARSFEAVYEFPFLAHASMEPMNCVVDLRPQSCEVWNGEQFQTADQAALAKLLGLQPDQVRLNMLYAGGSFGRRANPQSDFVLEAAAIAKAINGKVPVKLVWGREDDMRAGYYRPAYVHALRAGLNTVGDIVAWKHTIVGQSILTGAPRSRAPPTCPTRFPTSASSCTRPSSACRCSGGARSAPPTPRSPPSASSTSWRAPRARTPTSCAAACWRSTRATWRRSSSPRAAPIGAASCRRTARAASRCTSPSAPWSRKSWRFPAGRTTS